MNGSDDRQWTCFLLGKLGMRCRLPCVTTYGAASGTTWDARTG